VATVHHWTGLEAKALRLALRLSVRAFAEHLGVGVRTVSKWEKLKEKTEPRPDTQAILDTALARADAAAHLRFETFLSEAERPGTQTAGRRVTPTGPLAWEYESWTDDLDRAVVALARQDFTFAESLISRWTSRFTPLRLDDRGLYPFARSTALLGDLQRDQGSVVGPLSAHRSYVTAKSLFTQLDIPAASLSSTCPWPWSLRCPGSWRPPPASTNTLRSTTGSPAATGPGPGCGWGPR